MTVLATLATLALLTATPSASPPTPGAPPGRDPASIAARRQPADAAALPLERALTLAREHSPRRASAEALRLGTEAAAQRAGRVPNPVFEFRSENWTPGSTDDFPNDTYASVAQVIELGGKRGARRAVAQADLGGATAALADADRQLVLETADRYLDALRAREAAILLAEQRTSAAEIADVMRRRVDEGYAPEADLRLYQAQLARTDVLLLRARLELDRHLTTLGVLVGLPGGVTSAQLVEPLLSLPASGDPSTLAATAIERRPELAAARARLERARTSVALERAQRVPDVMVVGGYKRTAGLDTGVFAVQVPIPLSDRNTAAISRAEGELRAAQLDLDAITRALIGETEVTLRAATALVSRASGADRDLIQPAEIVRQAARASFREGAGEVLRLVEADRGWVEAQREALDLKLDAVRATIRARLALGEEIVP
jgi:cobalt-zinc-cadmium efflux system outer membrane protein